MPKRNNNNSINDLLLGKKDTIMNIINNFASNPYSLRTLEALIAQIEFVTLLNMNNPQVYNFVMPFIENANINFAYNNNENHNNENHNSESNSIHSLLWEKKPLVVSIIKKFASEMNNPLFLHTRKALIAQIEYHASLNMNNEYVYNFVMQLINDNINFADNNDDNNNNNNNNDDNNNNNNINSNENNQNQDNNNNNNNDDNNNNNNNSNENNQNQETQRLVTLINKAIETQPLKPAVINTDINDHHNINPNENNPNQDNNNNIDNLNNNNINLTEINQNQDINTQSFTICLGALLMSNNNHNNNDQ